MTTTTASTKVPLEAEQMLMCVYLQVFFALPSLAFLVIKRKRLRLNESSTLRALNI